MGRLTAVFGMAAMLTACGSSTTDPSEGNEDPEPGLTRATAVAVGVPIEVDALRTIDSPAGSYVSNTGRVRLTVTDIVRGDAAVDAIYSWDERNELTIGFKLDIWEDLELAIVTVRVDALQVPNEFDPIWVVDDQFNAIRKDGELYLHRERLLWGVPHDFGSGLLTFRQGSAILKGVYWINKTDDQPYLQYNRWESNARWFRLY